VNKKAGAVLLLLTAVNTVILVTAAYKGYKASEQVDAAKKNPVGFLLSFFRKPKEPAPGV